jgi:DNA-binding NtrC family response regulator
VSTPNSIKNRILVADDDETLCYVLKEQLLEKNFEIDIVYNSEGVFESLKKSSYDAILLDLNMPTQPGLETLLGIKDNIPSLPVIILTGQTDAQLAVECMKSGAFDYVVKPYNFEELQVVIDRAIAHKELVLKNEILEKQITQKTSEKIIGNSSAILSLIALAEKAAVSDSNVLVEGETGTGKELVAEIIHKNSSRAEKPFVVINCASLPDTLIESELFGYEKGAFTDAKTSKQGLVEIANGGTLFLDEIGEMSLTIQPKLLRFLENGEYRRVGGLTTHNSNVRVIGASNRNLLEEAEKKNFRRDLLFRLNVVTLTIPPLRDRENDIILLAEHFLTLKSPVRSPKNLTKEAKKRLMQYPFPGNIRELQHIIERAIIFSDDNLIRPDNLFLPQIKSPVTLTKRSIEIPEGESGNEILTIDELECMHITKVLKLNNWEQAKSAQQLGISPKTLYNKIKKYNLRQDVNN